MYSLYILYKPISMNASSRHRLGNGPLFCDLAKFHSSSIPTMLRGTRVYTDQYNPSWCSYNRYTKAKTQKPSTVLGHLCFAGTTIVITKIC